MTSDMGCNQKSALAQAAEWCYRLREPEVSEVEIVNWQNWLSESEANVIAFEEVEELMQLRGQMDQVEWPSETELLNDDYDGEITVAQWRQRRERKKRISWSDIFTFHWHRQWTLPRASFALVAIVSLAIVFTWWNLLLAPAGNLDIALYETQIGEHREVTLRDGSIISLGAKSLISVAYSVDQRRVVLERGEAFFDVAKDPKRPFIVVSGDRIITAVGTAFNVTRNVDRVVVTVTEGKVIVEEEPSSAPFALLNKLIEQKGDSEHKAALEAGQQLVYGSREAPIVATTDAKVATAWRQGRLNYMGEKLRYVIADVNRYSERPIRIGDERVAEMSFTGTVFQGNIDSWLQGIEEAFPIKVNKTTGHEIVLLLQYDN